MGFSEQAVKKALSLKASEAEAFENRRKTVQLEFADKIDNVKTVDSTGIGIRVALGKKIAMHATSILETKGVNEAVAKAIKIARVAPDDANWKHLNDKFGQGHAEGYFDKKTENLEYETIVEALVAAIDTIKDYDKRVKPTRGILSISTTDTTIANSHGGECSRKETNVSVWIRTKAKDGKMESTGNESRQTRFWKEVPFNDMALKASEKAVKFLSAKQVSGGKMPVVIRNQIFAGILGVLLSGPVNADWVQKGRSPLANKMGKEIASETIEIVDDGIMSGGWQTRPFDEEGHATQKTPIMKKGVLRNYVYDTYTALKADVKSTGNAERMDYYASPQPSPSNLILSPGKAKAEEIISETKKGIFVEETIGEWLSNPVSGNLNATITHGYLVRNGELKEPIKGVVISGNFYEILKNGIEIIGKDVRNNGQFYSPTVKLKQLTVAGKD